MVQAVPLLRQSVPAGLNVRTSIRNVHCVAYGISREIAVTGSGPSTRLMADAWAMEPLSTYNSNREYESWV
jgi:hypothetical protein